MKPRLLQLACVAAFGSLAFAAQAQQYGSPPSPTPPRMTQESGTAEPKTQADNEYRAAKARCNSGTLTERARSDCLRTAEDQYNHSFTHGTAAAGGGMGSPGPVKQKD